jgi:BASS family bile acid:Na+ symporter
VGKNREGRGQLIKLLRNWTLPIAMLAGIAGHQFIIKFTFIVPYLIFIMLFLSFTKVTFRELKPRPLHLQLLLIQAAAVPLVYLSLASFDKVLAQAVTVCFIAPTATSAAVVTQKLGGNLASITTYTMMSNLFAAAAMRVFFPLIEPHANLQFAAAFLLILKKLFLLLVLPFFCAQILRYILPAAHGKAAEYSGAAFYLWAVSLSVVTATTYYAMTTADTPLLTEAAIALAALAGCCFQFLAGKMLGSRYGDRISGGQALGQKNTILAIWMSGTYLNPVSALGPGSYVLWQNIINSWQLWRRSKN